jgi:hypothetical protein
VAVDVATVLDTVVTAPGAVLILAGTGNFAVQYVCAAGHGASTDANADTLPEHGRDVAACEVLPQAKIGIRIVLSREGFILEQLVDMEFRLKNHVAPQEPVGIYIHVHTRLLPDGECTRLECAHGVSE